MLVCLLRNDTLKNWNTRSRGKTQLKYKNTKHTPLKSTVSPEQAKLYTRSLAALARHSTACGIMEEIGGCLCGTVGQVDGPGLRGGTKAHWAVPVAVRMRQADGLDSSGAAIVRQNAHTGHVRVHVRHMAQRTFHQVDVLAILGRLFCGIPAFFEDSR